MKILYGYSKIKNKNSVLTIGNFDGVHKGHQKIIKQTVKLSKKKNLKSVVITFKPHPNEFLNKNCKPFKLTSEETKIEEIKKLGIDYLIFLKFDKTFNKLSPENFVKKLVNFRPKPGTLIIFPSSLWHYASYKDESERIIISSNMKIIFSLKDF